MQEIKISILGDICPTSDYRPLWDNGSAFNAIKPLLEDSDLKIVNLECPATNETTALEKCGPCLKAKPKDIKLIKETGFNLISLANNHILDFKEKGVLQTLETLKAENLDYVGAGANDKEAGLYKIYEIKGKKIGVIAFAEKEFNCATETTAGANLFDVYSSPEKVKELKDLTDYVICIYHGGIEHYEYPSIDLQNKCRMLVRFGADLVLCQHSHIIGTFENYQNGHILYGQGNGVYGYRSNSAPWNEGLLVTVTIGESVNISYTLINATENGNVVATAEESKARYEKIVKNSEKLSDKEFLKTNFKKFALSRANLNRPLFYSKGRVFIKLNRILKNIPFRLFTRRKKQMVTLNFMRCDALREVMINILESDVYDK